MPVLLGVFLSVMLTVYIEWNLTACTRSNIFGGCV